jgi:uncharacterized coiled-coil protein SlyX
LQQALRAMNAALRAGDMAAIGPLSQGLEQSLQHLDTQLPTQLPDLQSLRALATENRILLDAVGRGLRAATNRLSEIADARRGLRTYGPSGTSRAWVDQTGQGKRF